MYGPPIKGAPWLPRSRFVGNPVVPPGPIPPTPGLPSMDKPFLSRVPENEVRAKRFFDVMSDFFNSCLRQGFIVRTGPQDYQIKIPPTP